MITGLPFRFSLFYCFAHNTKVRVWTVRHMLSIHWYRYIRLANPELWTHLKARNPPFRTPPFPAYKGHFLLNMMYFHMNEACLLLTVCSLHSWVGDVCVCTVMQWALLFQVIHTDPYRQNQIFLICKHCLKHCKPR